MIKLGSVMKHSISLSILTSSCTKSCMVAPLAALSRLLAGYAVISRSRIHDV